MNLYDKAEIFPEKSKKLITTRLGAGGARLSRTAAVTGPLKTQAPTPLPPHHTHTIYPLVKVWGGGS